MEPHEYLAAIEADGILSRAECLRNNEASAALQLRLMLIFGHLAKALDVPKITRHRWEVPAGPGRVDLLLTHCDGSASLVEIKGERSVIEVAAGIGQLLIYEAALRLQWGNAGPALVRKILCSHVPLQSTASLIHACNEAGVSFVCLGAHDGFAALMRGAVERHHARQA